MAFLLALVMTSTTRKIRTISGGARILEQGFSRAYSMLGPQTIWVNYYKGRERGWGNWGSQGGGSPTS